MTNEEMQAALVVAEKQLAGLIKGTDALISAAGAGATDLCNAKEFASSQTIRHMEAELRATSASLTRAYAIGRGISTFGGGK